MTDDNHSLIDALVAFGTNAAALLRDRFGEPSLGLASYWDWKRVDEEVFAVTERTGWNTMEWYKIWDSANRLDSCEAALLALEADERTQGQLGRLVGTTRGQSTLSPERLFLSELIYPAVTEVNTFDIDANDLRPHAERLVETLAADVVEVRELVQLLGVDGDDAEVEVDEGVVFRRLTEDEIAALLRFNVIVSPLGEFDALSPTTRMIPRAHQCGLVARKPLPKVVGEAKGGGVFDHAQMGEIADSFVTAVRLKTRSKIARGRAVAFSGMWKSEPWEYANFGSAQSPPSADRMDLTAEELLDVATLTRQLRKPEVQKKLGLALRRFQDVPLRANDEDKPIDLMVAAEALFLPGSSDELTYKMAVRAGMFSDVEGVSHSQVFRFMKKAHRVRSEIIHGGKVKKPKRLDGCEGTVSEVTEDVEVVLSAALTKAVEVLLEDGSLPEWDDDVGDLLDAARLEAHAL